MIAIKFNLNYYSILLYLLISLPGFFSLKKCSENEINCLNGGTCYVSGISKTYFVTCICPKGFSGERCEISHCETECKNGGYCQGGSCICQIGFYGSHCQFEIDCELMNISNSKSEFINPIVETICFFRANNNKKCSLLERRDSVLVIDSLTSWFINAINAKIRKLDCFKYVQTDLESINSYAKHILGMIVSLIVLSISNILTCLWLKCKTRFNCNQKSIGEDSLEHNGVIYF